MANDPSDKMLQIWGMRLPPAFVEAIRVWSRRIGVASAMSIALSGVL